ncbi:hypothetical protein PAESOLCIP111_00847 [Paenibacillus solanacearum]|uniref:Uncharacterized protein n=1 Tax=Paenibacillus solanacearum TaxID=2048548 RepID=A0A916JWL5_9BACL|nr:hypothetical protein [Paenibacillus solanacearum]CAG7605802.1 hypothetical protein PAESOLCIP111_00847 [Paenibacillus solanacearum]
MEYSHKWALAMDLPEGKRAGYYAQVVKALAGKASLFDREKELLIFSSEAERSEAVPVMEQYAIPWDELPLLQLPAPVTLYRTFSDFGFTSRMENVYVYADLVSLFYLEAASASNEASLPPAELSAALAQLEEHLLAASAADSGHTLYAIESQHRPLAEGIAKAYGCSVRWVA